MWQPSSISPTTWTLGGLLLLQYLWQSFARLQRRNRRGKLRVMPLIPNLNVLSSVITVCCIVLGHADFIFLVLLQVLVYGAPIIIYSLALYEKVLCWCCIYRCRTIFFFFSTTETWAWSCFKHSWVGVLIFDSHRFNFGWRHVWSGAAF